MIDYIYQNTPGNDSWEGTFYERLVEYAYWDTQEFWRLHSALLDAAVLSARSEKIDRHLAECVIRIYSRVRGLVSAHFNANDFFKIQNLNDVEIHEFCERLDLAVIGVFSGEVLPESSFDLQNPMIENG